MPDFDKVRGLEKILDPGVFVGDAVLGQLFVEMFHVPVLVGIAIKFKDLIANGFWSPFGAGPLSPSVKKTLIAVFFDRLFPTSDGAFIDMKNFSSLFPG